MKITRKNIKALVFISLLIASLVSCGNLFTANIQTVTITGTIDMTEVNKSLLVNESTDYRTAWPGINAAGDYAAYTFKVTAVGSEGEKTGTVDIINKTYSIPGLVPGNTYSVRLEMFDSNGNVLLYGDAEVAVDSINTSGPEIILTEHQEGSGKIYLPIEIDTSSNIKKIHAELKGTDYSIDVSISGNSTYIDFPDIPSNSYTLQLKFYASNSESNTDDAKYSLVYRCTETVNVYDGMTTDQWVDNANSAYFTETDGHTTFKLTNECLQQWYMNTIYVNTNAINSEGSGTRTNPCTSILLGIEKALDPSKTGERTIFIVNDSSEKISKPIEINLNDNKLTIEACNYDSDTHEYMENDEASFTITASGGFHFTVNGGSLEIKGMNIASLYENTEYSTQNGAFFSISSDASATFTGCSFTDGETTEKGGAIYNEGTVILDSCVFSGNRQYWNQEEGTYLNNAIYCPDTEGVSPSLEIKGSTYFDTESGDTIELSNNSTITLDNEWELPEGAGDYCGNIKFNCEMPSSKEEAVRYPLFTGNLSSTAFTLENDYQSLTTDGYICQFPEAIYVDGSLELEYNSTDSEHPYGEGTVKKPYSNLNAFDYDNLSKTTFIYIKNGSDVSPSWIKVPTDKKLHFNVYNPVNGTINGEDDRAQIKSSQNPDYTLPNKTKDYTIRTIQGSEIWLANIDFINDDYTNIFGGGFLDINGKAHITKCTFNGGISSYSKGGGAIMLYDTAECTIEGCTFSNCQSTSTNTTGGGGAIYNSGTCDCEDCEFTECTAIRNGGAIFNADSASMTIKNVTIKSCSASYTMANTTSSGGDNIGGGAIYNAGSLTITRKEGSTSTAIVNTITQCSASFTYHQNYTGDSFNNLGGGAILNRGECTIEYCTISNNRAQITRTSTENSEGMVLFNSNKTTLNYCYLSSPNTSINDKAIYNTSELSIQNIYSNTKIDASIYCEGNATLTLGFSHNSQNLQSISLNALGNYAKITLAKSGGNIPKITSSETLNSSSYRFPLYFENISDFVGEDNSPFGDNVKTYADGIFSLADKNYAIEDGIIIEDLPRNIYYVDGKKSGSKDTASYGTIDNPFQTVCFALQRIKTTDPVTIWVKKGNEEEYSSTAPRFEKLNAEIKVYTDINSENEPVEATSDSDTASITFKSSNRFISNSNNTISFKNIIFNCETKVGGGNGGIFMIWGSSCNFTFTNCSFIGNGSNYVTGDGGLVYMEKTDTVSEFTNCEFKNGNCKPTSSQRSGGAIYNAGTMTLTNCTFEGNKTIGQGGAIYSSKAFTIKDCTFENNTMNTDTPNDIVVWCGSLTLKGKNTFSSPICCNQNESNSPSITVSDIDLTPGSPYAEISCFDWLSEPYAETGYQIISGLTPGQESWFPCVDEGYIINADGKIVAPPPAIALYINDSPEPTYPENLDEAFSSIHEDDSGTIRLLAGTTVEVGYSQLSQKTISIEVEGTGNATIKLNNQLDLGNNVNFNATGIIFDGEEINPETAYNSGGLFYIGCNDGSSRANVSFKQCTFKNGKSQDNGGALYVQDNLTLEDCTFENNTMNTDTPNDIVVWCGSLTLKGKNTFSRPICCNQNESNSPSITVSGIDLTSGSPYAEISCFDWLREPYAETGYRIISGLTSGQASWFPCVDEGGYAIDSDGKILKSFSSIPNVSDIATDSPVILTPDSGVSASDISTFLNSEGDFKVNLDLSNLSAADIQKIDPTLEHVDTLTLPGGNYKANLYGQDQSSGGGKALGLRKVIIKGDIPNKWLFQNCTGIEEVVFEEGCTTIPAAMFAGCKNLKTVTLPSTLKTIEWQVFRGTAIEEITIPASVTTIQNNVFYVSNQTTPFKLTKVIFEDTDNWSIKKLGTGEALVVEDKTYDPLDVTDSTENAKLFNSAPGCTSDYYLVKNEQITPAAADVGDIILSDGSVIQYSEGLTLTAEQKANAIAVIFYKGTELNNDGNTSAVRTLGIGLQQASNLMWCTTDASGYSLSPDSMVCELASSSTTETLIKTNTHRNGKNNFSNLSAYMDQNSIDNDTSVKEKYPAFYFAIDYADSASNVSGTAFENDWYLPSMAELLELYNNKATVNSALEKCEGTQLSGDYRSSSPGLGLDSNRAYSISMNDGLWSNMVKEETSFNICAIIEFN